jgi:outer membrane protein W
VSTVHRKLSWSAAALLLFVFAASGVRAEEIEKKFRLGFSVGSSTTTDQQQSPSANRRTLYKTNGEIDNFIFDPRNDSAAFSNFGIHSAYGADISASYAFTRNWYIEGSAGYQQSGVGNVELQAQFIGAPVLDLQNFNFSVFNLDGGTLTQVPIQLTAGYRFRPKAAFNPYVCAGIGYRFNSYAPSDAINELSRNLGESVGGFAVVEGTGRGGESFGSPTSYENLSGIKVDAPDAPEFHFGGGFEFTIKNKWAMFFDVRYAVYSGNFHMTVNGSDQLGISVPADQVVNDQPGAFGPFGSYLVGTGGLIDGGSLVPALTAPPGTDCAISPSFCELTGPKDGIPDPGYYYVHAGSVRYDGFTFQIGAKFTF